MTGQVLFYIIAVAVVVVRYVYILPELREHWNELCKEWNKPPQPKYTEAELALWRKKWAKEGPDPIELYLSGKISEREYNYKSMRTGRITKKEYHHKRIQIAIEEEKERFYRQLLGED